MIDYCNLHVYSSQLSDSMKHVHHNPNVDPVYITTYEWIFLTLVSSLSQPSSDGNIIAPQITVLMSQLWIEAQPICPVTESIVH